MSFPSLQEKATSVKATFVATTEQARGVQIFARLYNCRMLNNLQPWRILLTALARWINRHQLTVIEYL